jgi:hypothetical protein
MESFVLLMMLFVLNLVDQTINFLDHQTNLHQISKRKEYIDFLHIFITGFCACALKPSERKTNDIIIRGMA